MTDNSKLITNQEKFLDEIINNIIPSTKEMSFLVGYFYFSGFEKIYEKIKDKKLKILVGMDIEKDINNKVREFALIEDINISRGKIKNNFFNSLVQLFNDTDFFDSRKKQEAFKIYLQKIKDGSLEIKKTVQSNHAKMYLFDFGEENMGGVLPGMLITGSSNLSKAGLSDRVEVNVIIKDNNDFKTAKELFKNLWEKAVDIVDKNNIEDFLNSVVEKVWFEKMPTPFSLFIRVLYEIFSKEKKGNIKYPSEISKDKYFNFKYQIDAIDDAISIIEEHGGVIISDVVGLGKSIIASVIAYNFGLKTIIISPPHLKDQWEVYKWDFDFNARVYSSGKIKKAVEENKEYGEYLIIIDEAHKYRNELTETYADLHKLCSSNKVVLLTATPFNNRPSDIFSMIKLFQIPAKSTIQTVENLSIQFKKLITEYKKIQKSQKTKTESPEIIKNRIKTLADKIRYLISPLIIRRTRLDLNAINKYREDLEIQKIKFPKVNDPIALKYNLGNLSNLYLKTLNDISPKDEQEGFIGARYKPVLYLKDFKKYKKRISNEFGDETLFKQAQTNIAIFMRRLLVSRFESSIYAFKKTLNYMIESSYTMLEWYEKAKLIPIYKKGYLPNVETLLSDMEGALSDEMKDHIFENSIEKLREKGFEFIPSNEIKIAFKTDILKDIKLLERIRDNWFINGIEKDPKLEYFTDITKRMLEKEPDRKIVVFTSYADTANYIYDNLKDKLKVFTYSGSNSTKEKKRILKDNFDAGWDTQKNDFNLLIATDAISEGYNLHRAGTVFNYDIPYNPTRVIQRVGRINRINKKVFDELFIYNFFPTDIGEDETNVKGISTLKKSMIDALMGDDTKVLTSDEELESYFTKKYREKESEQEELSWDTDYINMLNSLKKNSPEIIDKIRKIPKRVRIQRTADKDIKGVLVFGKKGKDYIFKLGINNEDYILVPVNEALEYFSAETNEEAKKVSNKFEDIYQNVKKNLFLTSSQTPSDKGKSDALKTLLFLKTKTENRKDYITDLIFVISKLDAIPERLLKDIRALEIKEPVKSVETLIENIPYDYIISLMDKAKRVEDGEEQLILAEEFI